MEVKNTSLLTSDVLRWDATYQITSSSCASLTVFSPRVWKRNAGLVTCTGPLSPKCLLSRGLAALPVPCLDRILHSLLNFTAHQVTQHTSLMLLFSEAFRVLEQDNPWCGTALQHRQPTNTQETLQGAPDCFSLHAVPFLWDCCYQGTQINKVCFPDADTLLPRIKRALAALLWQHTSVLFGHSINHANWYRQPLQDTFYSRTLKFPFTNPICEGGRLLTEAQLHQNQNNDILCFHNSLQ